MVGMTKYERVCQPTVAVVSVALNVPPIVLGILGSAVEWCPYYSKWLVYNSLLCFLNLLAAFYSIYKLRRKIEYDVEYSTDDNNIEQENEKDDNNQENLQETKNDVEKQVQDGELGNPRNTQSPQEQNFQSNLVGDPGENDNDVDVTNPEAKQGEEMPQPTTEAQVNSSIGRRGRMDVHGIKQRFLNLRTTSSNRIRYLVCYDGIITTYGIMFLFWIFWLGNGAQLQQNVEYATQELDGCSGSWLDKDYNFVTSSVAVGFAYFAFIMLCLFASYLDHR